MKLKGTETEKNLTQAFEHQVKFASALEYAGYRSGVEGHNALTQQLSTSARMRSTQAMGCIRILGNNPMTGTSIDITRLNLQAAIDYGTYLFHDVYPQMAEQARTEGFEDIANWFDTLAKAERMEVKLYQDALKTLLD